VQRLGLADCVSTAVTIASPHSGTAVAHLGRGALAAALRPSSALLRELAATAGPSPVRWVAYYSDTDLVVPPRSARLDAPALRARNVLVPEQGHTSILWADALLDDVVGELLAAEPAVAATAAPEPLAA
jgi:triacylglycerol lipase